MLSMGRWEMRLKVPRGRRNLGAGMGVVRCTPYATIGGEIGVSGDLKCVCHSSVDR